MPLTRLPCRSRNKNLFRIGVENLAESKRLSHKYETAFYFLTPSRKTEIEEKVGKLGWDDDSKRFGLNIFRLEIGDFIFLIWLDENQVTVNSFYS